MRMMCSVLREVGLGLLRVDECIEISVMFG